MQADVAGDGQEFTVTLRAGHPALWTWLDVVGADARYSDNFVHLAPGTPMRIVVRLMQPISRAEFTWALQVRSLFDTYTTQ